MGSLDRRGEWLLPPYTRQVIWQDAVIMANHLFQSWDRIRIGC